MSASGLLAQLLNGLASASSLFLVSVGLSLIFGVTRTINFAHGSFYMVGIYVAYALVERLNWLGFWLAVPSAALVVGLLGVRGRAQQARQRGHRGCQGEFTSFHVGFLLFAPLWSPIVTGKFPRRTSIQ